MPRIVENTPQGWRELLKQEGYQSRQSPVSLSGNLLPTARPPEITESQIPDFALDPNNARGQLWLQSRAAGYVPKGQQRYGPREMGITQQTPQRQSILFDPSALTRTKRAPVSIEQRANVAEYRTTRDAEQRKITDERLVRKMKQRLARFDPEERKKQEARIDANRAKRGLGPISGPQVKDEFVDVESFADIDPDFVASGQYIRNKQGGLGVVSIDRGIPIVTPLKPDPRTGQLVPDLPPTLEEQRETQEHEAKMADIWSRTAARGGGGLSTEATLQEFDWDTEFDDLKQDIALYQGEIDQGVEQQQELELRRKISAAKAAQRGIIVARSIARIEREEAARQLKDRQDLAVTEEELRTGKPIAGDFYSPSLQRTVTQQEIAETAKIHNLSIEEVKKKLGIK